MTSKHEETSKEPIGSLQFSAIEQHSEQNASTVPSLHEPDDKPTEVFRAEFKPSARLYLAFLTLCVMTLMVALDGTSLSVALPVSKQFITE